MKRWPQILATLALSIAVFYSVIYLLPVFCPPYRHWQQKRMVERVLATDPNDLLKAGRQLLASKPDFVGNLDPSSAEVPIVFRRLKPTYVYISKSCLTVNFDHVVNPFGVAIFRDGYPARFKREWIEGLWLFDDGQLRKFGLENWPNKNQPSMP